MLFLVFEVWHRHLTFIHKLAVSPNLVVVNVFAPVLYSVRGCQFLANKIHILEILLQKCQHSTVANNIMMTWENWIFEVIVINSTRDTIAILGSVFFIYRRDYLNVVTWL